MLIVSHIKLNPSHVLLILVAHGLHSLSDREEDFSMMIPIPCNWCDEILPSMLFFPHDDILLIKNMVPNNMQADANVEFKHPRPSRESKDECQFGLQCGSKASPHSSFPSFKVSNVMPVFVMLLNVLIFRLVPWSQKLVSSIFKCFSANAFICSLLLSVLAGNVSAILDGKTTSVVNFTSSPVDYFIG